MNDFYTVHELQPGNDSMSCVIVFNSTHAIFEGHFPQQPVVPGVCMIQIIKELLQRQLGKGLLLRNTGQVKFLQLIVPGISPEIHLNWQEKEQGYVVNALFRKDTDLFKFAGTFQVT